MLAHLVLDIGHKVTDFDLAVTDGEQGSVQVGISCGLVCLVEDGAVNGSHKSFQIFVVLLELVFVLCLFDDQFFRLLGAHVFLDAFGEAFLFLFKGAHARIVN